MQSKYFIIGLIAVSVACTSKKIDYSSMPDDKLMKVADSLAQTYIMVDGHVDLPYRLTIKRFQLTKEF
jgi:membrane dipeptidase